jgi:polyisoprenyl-phosphate glycosyltransferase
MPRISVVFFFLNEADNLPRLYERMQPVLANLNAKTECILVDDHSTDTSSNFAKAWAAKQLDTIYLRLSRNCGSHAAIAAGLSNCSGDCAVIMAADLQDPPEVIPELLNRWREGYDVVWAYRAARHGESVATKVASRIFYKILQIFALSEMPAKGADFFLIDRKVIDAYNAIPEKHTNCMALILWMGFRQTSIEYIKEARTAGRSKWTFAKKLKLFVDSLVSFSYAPIRLMSVLGVLMAVAGFLYASVVVAGRLTGWVTPGTGFAAIMTALLIGQGMIMTMLGVLGEYLWRAFDEARGRPRYMIEEFVGSPLEQANERVERLSRTNEDIFADNGNSMNQTERQRSSQGEPVS